MIILGDRKWSAATSHPTATKRDNGFRRKSSRWNNGRLDANRRQMLAGIGLVFEIKTGISDSSADLAADIGYGSMAI